MTNSVASPTSALPTPVPVLGKKGAAGSDIIGVEKHWSCTVRFLSDFKGQTTLNKIVRFISCFILIPLSLIVDGCVFVIHNIIDGLLRQTKNSGVLSKTIIETGKEAIKALGSEAAETVKKEAPGIFITLETKLVEILENEKIKTAIGGFITSEQIKGAVKEFIAEQGETALETAKRILTDDGLEKAIATLGANVVADTATAVPGRAFSNAGNGVKNAIKALLAGLTGLKGDAKKNPEIKADTKIDLETGVNTNQDVVIATEVLDYSEGMLDPFNNLCNNLWNEV